MYGLLTGFQNWAQWHSGSGCGDIQAEEGEESEQTICPLDPKSSGPPSTSLQTEAS